MKVKICGITNLEDALFAAKCGADALGFVLYPPSKRYIAPEKVAEIVRALPPFVLSVGVFAQDSASEVAEMAEIANIQLLQLHNETLFHASYVKPSLKVARIAHADDILNLPSGFVLCDTYCAEFGGAGLRTPLEFFRDCDCSRIILAGGLNDENINELEGFGFYGVDVSSGVEKAAGKKDAIKIQKFINNAKKI